MDASTPADSTAPATQPATARFAARLASASGRDLVVEGYWRPVLALVEASQRGWALTYRIRTADAEARPIAFDSLNAVDRERVTLAAVRHAVKVLPQAEAGGGPAPMALIPVPWSCAKVERVRRELLRLGGLARGARRVVPVAELTDLEPGAPAAALAETAAGLKPMFGGVLVRLAGRGGGDVPRLMDRGFAGASLEADGLQISPDRPILVGLAALMKAVGPMPGLQGVANVAALEAAREAGFAWASLDLLRGGWHLFHAGLEALRAPRGD